MSDTIAVVDDADPKISEGEGNVRCSKTAVLDHKYGVVYNSIL
jgi:hypothetical protein